MITRKLFETVGAALRRSFCSSNVSKSHLHLENISSSRSLIRVSGVETEPFLQGLITNDIKHISPPNSNAAMFTMFLNKPGRVLYDAIVYKLANEANTFYVECDRRIDDGLRKHLLAFRVRKKIDIDIVNDDLNVWTAYRSDVEAKVTKNGPIGESKESTLTRFDDPRCHAFGSRIVASTKWTDNDLINIFWPNDKVEMKSNDYDYMQHRYKFGIGEGIDEIISGKSFPFEINCDYLHGISFHKGCYLGQEFTARTYHTGVIRKRLMPIQLTANGNDLQVDTAILNENNETIGKLRGAKNTFAIGVLHVEKALQNGNVRINEVKGSVNRPFWWPSKPLKSDK